MLHLLQPIWLLASAGIIVPLAIHLWNIRQGKTLRIGSVELLTSTAQQRARSLRFTELFLLLLRCLLIVLLALLLAKPYWQNTANQKGWVVIQKENSAEGYIAHQHLLDSLSDAGYGFHWFEKGFPETDLSKIKNAKNDTSKGERASYWQLLKQLDSRLAAEMPVYLVTGNEIYHFTGERPELNIALDWKTFSRKDTTHLFIAEAYETTKDSIAVLMGSTSVSGTAHHVEMLGTHQPRQKEFSIGVLEGRMQVSYQNQPAVMVDTSTLRVSVFADVEKQDAQYLQAAIRSVQQVSGRKIELTTVSLTAAIPENQDWVFWLSAHPLPEQLKGKHILAYAGGAAIPAESWIRFNKDAMDRAELYQRTSYTNSGGDVWWSDGFGVPLLTKQDHPGKTVYYAYTHFNPSWTDLVWSASFPQIIYDLISPSPETTGANELRAIDESQLKFEPTPSVKKTVVPGVAKNDAAARVFWCLAFLLFCIERYYSFRIKKIRANA